MSFISFTSKWLNPAIFAHQSNFEREADTFSWLDRLVNRLENTTRYSWQGFQRPGYESSHRMNYRWFDPRHWMGMATPENSEEIYGDIADFEQEPYTGPGLPPFKDRSVAAQRTAAKISNKFIARIHVPDSYTQPEPALLQSPEPIEPAQEIQFSRATSLDNNTVSGPGPVAMPHIAAPSNIDVTNPDTDFILQTPGYGEIPGIETEKGRDPKPQAIKHYSPISDRIHSAVAQFVDKVYRVIPGLSADNQDITHPGHASIGAFINMYFGNKQISPLSRLSPGIHEAEFPGGIGLAPTTQGQGFSDEQTSAALPWTGVQEHNAAQFEDRAFLPFYAPDRPAQSFNFSYEIAEQPYAEPSPFTLPVPVSGAVPFQQATEAAAPAFPVSSPVSTGSGINSGPVYLAMAPLLRSMPAELALRPMPEELREGTSETEEEPAETEEQQEQAYDPEALATEVYAIIKRRILIEKERSRGSI